MKHKNQKTPESYMLSNGIPGDSFLSQKPDRHITSLATYYGRKITTERKVLVTTAKAEVSAEYVVKVTIIQ